MHCCIAISGLRDTDGRLHNVIRTRSKLCHIQELFIGQEVHVDAWLFLDWSDAYHYHSRSIFVDTG
jgi:hypothetical protein